MPQAGRTASPACASVITALACGVMALRASRPHATPFAAPASRRTLRRPIAPRASVAPALVVGTHTQQGCALQLSGPAWLTRAQHEP